jgi:acetyl-CoA carboxylase alpha subunit
MEYPFPGETWILPTYIDEGCAPRFPLEGDKRGEVAEALQSGLARSREGPFNPVAKKRRSRMKIKIMKRSKSKIRSKSRIAPAAA